MYCDTGLGIGSQSALASYDSSSAKGTVALTETTKDARYDRCWRGNGITDH